MKAIQKIIHFLLILVISLAAAGFRLNISDCPDEKQKTSSFSGSQDCCCNKSIPESQTDREDCGSLTCVLPSAVYISSSSYTSYEQKAKGIKATSPSTIFTAIIFPALLEVKPSFSLPPPQSGRFKGILNQTFLI